MIVFTTTKISQKVSKITKNIPDDLLRISCTMLISHRVSIVQKFKRNIFGYFRDFWADFCCCETIMLPNAKKEKW
jgi:hypothetical protein